MKEVCVIGAGIVGASVAYHLSRLPNVRVTIVDAGYPGAGVTEAGTGWVTARGTADEGYRNLRLHGMEEHLRLAELFPSTPWLTVGGTLLTEDADGDFDGTVAESREHGMPVEVLSAAQVNAQLEPNVVFERPDLRVAHFTSEFSVIGSLLTRILFESATESGAIGHIGSRVIGLGQLSGGRHRVTLDDGTWIDADAVVNAAGASADQVAGLYGIPMPMRPQPGIGVLVKVNGQPLGRMITVEGLAIKPEIDGVIRLRSLLGWKSDVGAASRDSSFTGGMERNEFVDHVVGQFERVLPGSAPIRSVVTRVGIRPFPADGLPRVGEVAAVPGYYDAVMHSGGVLAPLIGRLLAYEIATGEQSELLAAYRPGRFLETESSLTAGDAAGTTL
ncbi:MULTISPECIES: FAD-dependent oxidoreductase [unclassified Cryobacterium]|uniref:FAD-dependent oxidoreductase n=1 Tax=unclassified Cryobacterium TaxID=2649013 RepID=UPI00144603E3